MITIISGTNRPQNISIKIASAVAELLTTMDQQVQILDLQKLPSDFAFKNDVFGNPDPGFSTVAEQFVANADKFVFVIPEYNGSFPGVCKAFIDSVWPDHFKGKKAALVGLSSGRAGNLRGVDHLTGILHYLNIQVLPTTVNIIHVDAHLSDDGYLNNQKTLQQLQQLSKGLIAM
ncbi:MAG: NADPH-dependent FMN reductase [Salibacteraceae bacterium]